jgi:hypothetical protein
MAALLSACSGGIPVGAAPVTEQWTPPYLELHLLTGKAQIQWADESEWMAMEGKSSIAIAERGLITTDEGTGAEFYLGDGSTLEMSPGATVELRNPRTMPRLQVIVHQGNLQFFAQKPSYEFEVSGYPLTLLSVPALLRFETDGEEARVAVEEGAVTCDVGENTLTLPQCREMRFIAGEEPEVTEFCTVSTIVAPPTPTPRPGSAPSGAGAEPAGTATPVTPTATPVTPTVTPRVQITPTLTSTPVPPTDTPAPPKPKEPKDQEPTQPPSEPEDKDKDKDSDPTEPPPEPTKSRPTPAPPDQTDEPRDTPDPSPDEPRDTPEPSGEETEEPADPSESPPDEPRDTPEAPAEEGAAS